MCNLPNKSKLHIVQLHVIQMFMDVANSCYAAQLSTSKVQKKIGCWLMNRMIYLKLRQKQFLLKGEQIHKTTTIFTQNVVFRDGVAKPRVI